MAILITQRPIPQPAPIVDFGWYYGVSPTRLGEFTYDDQGDSPGNLWPPGRTTLTGNITLPVATIAVASTASFSVGPGTIKLDNGANHTTVNYTGMTGTSFTGCTGGTGTFATGVQVYDPRFYVDQLPLNQPITFDAVDSHGLGLPIVQATVPIINYQWNFGNGFTSFGTTATTEYTFGAPPPSIQCTLTVTDALGRQYATAKRLNIQTAIPIYGTVRKVG